MLYYGKGAGYRNRMGNLGVRLGHKGTVSRAVVHGDAGEAVASRATVVYAQLPSNGIMERCSHGTVTNLPCSAWHELRHNQSFYKVNRPKSLFKGTHVFV